MNIVNSFLKVIKLYFSRQFFMHACLLANSMKMLEIMRQEETQGATHRMCARTKRGRSVSVRFVRRSSVLTTISISKRNRREPYFLLVVFVSRCYCAKFVVPYSVHNTFIVPLCLTFIKCKFCWHSLISVSSHCQWFPSRKVFICHFQSWNSCIIPLL